jgi:hypothetical protein
MVPTVERGDGGRDALDPLHPRAVHAVQELPGIGGEGLYVAALTLGVNSVEGQRRLARTAHPGHHDQFPQGQLQIQPLEVVLARAFDTDVFLGHDDVGSSFGVRAKERVLLAERGGFKGSVARGNGSRHCRSGLGRESERQPG